GSCPVTGKSTVLIILNLYYILSVSTQLERLLDMHSVIYWFDELGKEHNAIVGKKCANLGEMVRMGLAVPPGFAIPIDMYRQFIKETGAEAEMSSYIRGFDGVKGAGIQVFEEMSAHLRSLIEEKEMLPSARQGIASYYAELCHKTGTENVAVSVRSAGTESRPGMFETYLNVRGIEELLAKIKKVWASAFTPRAIAFRANRELPILGDELGVAVPKMVNARAAGIAFTVNPVDGDASKITIEANWGLGEGVVSGVESVDTFQVDKNTLEIAAKHTGNKMRGVFYTETGADWFDVPAEKRGIPCILDEEAVEIARVAKSVEETLKSPQDMEWAVDQDIDFPQNIFWVQTRPAKVAAKKVDSAANHIADLMAKKFRGF
ncbi:MAG: PEP/pyruvate-binding domain-containing protein, partial [Dehalococcoidia bacterium]